MMRKWILASLASAVMAAGMVGCGEEPAAPPAKPPVKKEKISTATPKVDTATKPSTAAPKVDTATKPSTEKKTE